LSACSLYHRQYRAGAGAHVSNPNYDLYFIESDDNGWFWEPAQAQSAFEAVRSSAAAGDTFVVLFVAGWHHLSRCCDDNVEGFKEVLTRINGELARSMYREARRRVHGTQEAPMRVIGIYLGWRGRSLPGLIDYATFFGRKAAAMRVGESDVREFLVRLRDFYVSHGGTATPGGSRNLLGLITIGHSFGGQVVLRATSTFIEHELMQFGAPPAYLRERPSGATGTTPSMLLGGFGDLIVLINPAVEAAAYQRLHALGIRARYSDTQTPVMLTISADNDGPRGTYFPLGRILGEWLTTAPHIADARERGLERRALGFATEQVTHRLEPVDGTMRLKSATRVSQPEPACVGHDRCEYTWYDWANRPAVRVAPDTLTADEYSRRALASIASHDFSATTVFDDVVLKPVSGNIPHQALIVASASPNIIDGHNGMFCEPLLRFLTRYIGFIEARRKLPLSTLQSTSPER